MEKLFQEQGLLPAIVQDWRDGSVLMIGFMNQESLERTLKSRHVHFWSRSRRALWEKGETSGHYLLLKDLFIDCDQDAVLVKAEPVGPTCHTGEPSCFFTRIREDGTLDTQKTMDAFGGILERIYRTIMDRKERPVRGSYVRFLLEAGQDRILKKIAEEAGEVILASKNAQRKDLIHEVADLLFHLLLVLGYHDIALADIYRELAARADKPGGRFIDAEGEQR
jgi:phosphoribosyl-ATP pyrophosphohydrolase/phosphoribosyl-AMP cyclohydrolase